jgi:hypothetical protein
VQQHAVRDERGKQQRAPAALIPEAADAGTGTAGTLATSGAAA